MTAPVMRDHPETMLREEQQLAIPCVGGPGPDRRSGADDAPMAMLTPP